MPTLLTNKKMSPELRARVEASVTGRKPTQGSRWTPRSRMWMRALGATAALAAVVAFGVSKQQADREVEALRGRVLAQWDEQASGFGAKERAVGARVEPWLRREAKRYSGDWVAKELEHGGLERLLGRPLVYVRGAHRRFAGGDPVQAIARDSEKDAFLLCLLDPPRKRSEKVVLKRVRSAYLQGERMQRSTAHAASLGSALKGLPVLDPAWRERAASADGLLELTNMEKELRRVPLESAKRAARAPLLLYVMDETADGKAPAELDGERPHRIRAGLIDLSHEKPLLRVRRRVDPSWLSDASRVEFARGMNSCALAYDIRQLVDSEADAAESARAP